MEEGLNTWRNSGKSNPLHERFGYLSLVGIGAPALLLGLFLRSALFLSIVDFALGALVWLGIVGGALTIVAGIVALGNEKNWWNKITESSINTGGGRMLRTRGVASSAIFILILIFFFLPWLSVGLYDNVSGADMIQANQYLSRTLADSGATVPLIIAFILAIAGTSMFFVRAEKGKLIRAGIGGVGILCIFAFIVLASGALPSGASVGWGIGLVLSAVGYIAAIIIQFVPMPSADQPPKGK